MKLKKMPTLVILLLFLGFPLQSHIAFGQDTEECSMMLEIIASSGFRSPGTIDTGELQIHIDASGAIDGQLVETIEIPETERFEGDTAEIPPRMTPVVGQAIGRAIHLVFELSENVHRFGVGTGVENIRECSGTWAGTFFQYPARNLIDGHWIAIEHESQE